MSAKLRGAVLRGAVSRVGSSRECVRCLDQHAIAIYSKESEKASPHGAASPETALPRLLLPYLKVQLKGS